VGQESLAGSALSSGEAPTELEEQVALLRRHMDDARERVAREDVDRVIAALQRDRPSLFPDMATEAIARVRSQLEAVRGTPVGDDEMRETAEWFVSLFAEEEIQRDYSTYIAGWIEGLASFSVVSGGPDVLPDDQIAETLRETSSAYVQRVVERVLAALAPENGGPAAPTRPVRPCPLPSLLPQQTFQEAKTIAIAIADGPTGRRWTSIDGELALRHAVKGSPLETKLIGSPMLDWLGLPSTVESLRGELQEAGLPAVLLLHVTLGAALDKVLSRRAYVTVSIDELVGAIGWEPRSRVERTAMRRRVWRWIALFHHMEVIGRRDGKFRDPDTRELVDTTSRDALVQIVGRQMPRQLAFDDSTPPLEVTYVAGPWIEQWKGDHRLLTYLGDVRKLAAIKAGKPSGAWAQAIGLALNQCWRERASYADPTRVGEDKRLTVRFAPFTRRQLLDLFPPTPSVGEVLEGPHPARAREYWDEGIKHLQRKHLVAHYAELTPTTTKRKGWAADWLDQPLDIRPSKTEADAIATIATRARARKKALAARKRQPEWPPLISTDAVGVEGRGDRETTAIRAREQRPAGGSAHAKLSESEFGSAPNTRATQIRRNGGAPRPRRIAGGALKTVARALKSVARPRKTVGIRVRIGP
jgi:hypothetical protein